MGSNASDVANGLVTHMWDLVGLGLFFYLFFTFIYFFFIFINFFFTFINFFLFFIFFLL